MRHKSVHQYFKYVISVKIFGPTSTRGSVCSQSIYSIYIYLYLGLLLIAAKNRQGYLSAESFNIILISLLGWEVLSTYHGLLWTVLSPQANMNHEPSIILFPDFRKNEKKYHRLHNTNHITCHFSHCDYEINGNSFLWVYP